MPATEPSPPRDNADYGRFLQALVGRYGPQGLAVGRAPGGHGAGRSAQWQIWNEPNLDQLLVARSRSRAATCGCCAPPAAHCARPTRGARVDPRRPAEPELGGAAVDLRRRRPRAFDAVALHPYTGKPRNVVKLVELARRVMRRYGDAPQAVWVTELSWPAALGKADPTRASRPTEKGQAKRLGKALLLLAAKRRVLRIERVYWYTWLSTEAGPNAFDYSGLRRLRAGKIVSAPALRAFRETARRLRR